MNAPTPALVARPERLRLVGQRRQVLAVMHQRLMFGMLVYAGIVALIALRILWLAAFGDHAGRKVGLTSLIPERGDIVDRDGEPLARTIDAWIIALHPTRIIGDKLDLARRLAALMPERTEEQYFALLRSGKSFVYLRRRAAPSLVEAVFRNALRRWFGPLFWFCLLGPFGAALYRLATLSAEADAEVLPQDTRNGARALLAVLEWPLAQLVTLSLALVGNFDSVMAAWREDDAFGLRTRVVSVPKPRCWA